MHKRRHDNLRNCYKRKPMNSLALMKKLNLCSYLCHKNQLNFKKHYLSFKLCENKTTS